MKYIFLGCTFIFFFFGVFISAHGQSYDPIEYIEWQEHSRLSWEMFAGEPDTTSFGDAGTAVKIQAHPYFAGKELHYRVHALFSRKKSWFKHKSPELLAHEQLHFDIAELTARKVRQEIYLMKNAQVDDIKAFNEAIEKILIESNSFDEHYDRETLHGILSDKQEEWEQEIKLELKRLNRFKQSELFIQSSN